MAVLRAELEEYGIKVECGMELVEIEQEDAGVNATFRHDDISEEVRAAYLRIIPCLDVVKARAGLEGVVVPVQLLHPPATPRARARRGSLVPPHPRV